jgi:hypothetical protein
MAWPGGMGSHAGRYRLGLAFVVGAFCRLSLGAGV